MSQKIIMFRIELIFIVSLSVYVGTEFHAIVISEQNNFYEIFIETTCLVSVSTPDTLPMFTHVSVRFTVFYLKKKLEKKNYIYD